MHSGYPSPGYRHYIHSILDTNQATQCMCVHKHPQEAWPRLKTATMGNLSATLPARLGRKLTSLTFCISLIQRLTSFCRAFKKVESPREPLSSSVLGLRLASFAFFTTLWMVGWMGREISGMSMFCWRWSRPTSSSLIFFWTEGTSLSPVLRGEINKRKNIIARFLPGSKRFQYSLPMYIHCTHNFSKN